MNQDTETEESENVTFLAPDGSVWTDIGIQFEHRGRKFRIGAKPGESSYDALMRVGASMR